MTIQQIIARHFKEMKVWYIVAAIFLAIGIASETKANNYFVPVLTGFQTKDIITTAYSYDGKARDVSKFYERKVPTLNITSYFSYEGVRGNVSVNTGIETAKLSVSPSISGTIGKTVSLDKGWSLSGDVSWSLSGSTKHSPCHDNFHREYYCGSLTAWSDFGSKSTKSKFQFNSINVRLVKEF